MKTLIALLAWCLLLVLCWPLAILALVLWPLVWLLSLPFRLVGITFTALPSGRFPLRNMPISASASG